MKILWRTARCVLRWRVERCFDQSRGTVCRNTDSSGTGRIASTRSRARLRLCTGSAYDMNRPLQARLTRVLSWFHRSGTDSTRVVCTLRSRARTRGVYECLSRATCIAILFLTFLSVSCGTFSKSWTRVIPRARRELRRNFLRDWKRTLEDGRDGENFHTSK